LSDAPILVGAVVVGFIAKISFVSTRISNNTSDGFTNNAKQLHKKRSSYTDTNVISSRVADITFVSVYLDRFLCGVL
jgi:hypothetical protein